VIPFAALREEPNFHFQDLNQAKVNRKGYSMASTKRKAKTRTVVRFMDLPSRKNPRGGKSVLGIKVDYGMLKLNPQHVSP
jgi:hypothetical protein